MTKKTTYTQIYIKLSNTCKECETSVAEREVQSIGVYKKILYPRNHASVCTPN